MKSHKSKKKARLKDLAESIRIHMDTHPGKFFRPNYVAKHFKTTIGAVRSAVRQMVINREARWVFGQTFLGPSKGGSMKHIFERR
jgi:hypothetical protein